MRSLLRFIGTTVFLLVVLSITIKDETIFDHIYGVISPATKSAQKITESFVAKSFESTEEYGRKIFDNSVPKLKDSVKSKLSANKRKLSAPLDDIPVEDKQQLERLIKSHK